MVRFFGFGGHEEAEKGELDEEKPTKPAREYPKGAFFLLGSEFAERFSYHTCRALLVALLMTVHHFSEKDAEIWYHVFVVFCYLTPICGSLVADGCLGRFCVIIIVSVIHCVGHLIMCVGATHEITPNATIGLHVAALVLVAIGTGGIRSCAMTFAGDQFPTSMYEEKRRFTSFFYLSVMLGAVLAEYIGPMLKKIKCGNEDTCFPLAFGFPAILVVFGFVIFLCGIRYYTIVKYEQNILCRVFKCLGYSIYKSFLCCGVCRKPAAEADQGLVSYSKIRIPSWLDPAEELYGLELVTDIKTLWRMMLLFLIGIPFWALYDQEGSSWYLQAKRLDGTIGAITLLPEQISLLGPLFVCFLLPLVNLVMYPFLWPKGCLVKPLRRMGYGGVMAALSFIAAGILQLVVDKSTKAPPASGFVRSLLINYGRCAVEVIDTAGSRRVEVDEYITQDFVPPVYLSFGNDCPPANRNQNVTWISEEEKSNGSKVGHFAVLWDDVSIYTFRSYDLHREGNSRLHAIAHPKFLEENSNASIVVEQSGQVTTFPLSRSGDVFSIQPPFITRLVYDIILQECKLNDLCYDTSLADNKTMKMGSQHLLAFDKDRRRRKFIELVQPNSVNILWMIPQYLLMSLSEVMFVLSGSEFAYSQASASMKSTVHSIWLLSVAAGNGFVILTIGIDIFVNHATEFFCYAAIMLIALVVFAWYSKDYEYLDRSKIKYVKSGVKPPKTIPLSKKAASDKSEDSETAATAPGKMKIKAPHCVQNKTHPSHKEYCTEL